MAELEKGKGKRFASVDELLKEPGRLDVPTPFAPAFPRRGPAWGYSWTQGRH
jgi:hypothetical protein